MDCSFFTRNIEECGRIRARGHPPAYQKTAINEQPLLCAKNVFISRRSLVVVADLFPAGGLNALKHMLGVAAIIQNGHDQKAR